MRKRDGIWTIVWGNFRFERMENTDYDVVIIGGGPGGSTTGTLLKKYAPRLRVCICEREQFPREHVGESQLPPIGAILHEMGCWEKVEAANFPIKVGATYRWGTSTEMWDFDFVPASEFHDAPRPSPYAGQRVQTALQVERAVYDDILLKHAGELGCDVRMPASVSKIVRSGDRVESLRLTDGQTLRAKWYVDASGHAGVLRRGLDIRIECPTNLKNIAIWDYWENAKWADEIGVGGTRVQIMSLPHGWIWFIPVGPTKTSIGLICPAEYAKQSDLTTEQLYLHSIESEQRIQSLVEGGIRGGALNSTTDWSFLADRTVGENWFLVGESAGFADPVLAAGMTLTHTSAREAAYTLVDVLGKRHQHDVDWLKHHFDVNQRSRIRQHIRFADFWYAANGQFTDLQDHCRDIAESAGLKLTAAEAFAWLAQGGFTNDVVGQAGIGGLDLAATKQITQQFTGQDVQWSVNRFNVFKLNVNDQQKQTVPTYADGKIAAVTCYVRDARRLALVGTYELMFRLLERFQTAEEIVKATMTVLLRQYSREHAQVGFLHCIQALEVMVSEGWVDAEFDPSKPRLNVSSPRVGGSVHPHQQH